jgi:hypothetical protein
MMTANAPYKFGWLPDGTDDEPYAYPNIWAREKTSGPDRLLIAPAADQIGLLLKLSACMQPPFRLLYVLVVTRAGSELGRYQSPSEIDKQQLESFLSKYSAYLERDGRHAIWLMSPTDQSMLIYDRHNVIYAYGTLDRFSAILQKEGLSEAAEVRFPSPHSHHYNSEFDADETRILNEFEWNVTPLRASDVNPDD